MTLKLAEVTIEVALMLHLQSPRSYLIYTHILYVYKIHIYTQDIIITQSYYDSSIMNQN